MKILLIGGALFGVLVGLLAIGAAGAQEGDRLGERFIAKVAEKLGVSEEALTIGDDRGAARAHR